MPNNRRQAIKQETERALGNLDWCTQHLYKALAIVRDFVIERSEQGQEVTEEHVATGEALNAMVEQIENDKTMLQELHNIL